MTQKELFKYQPEAMKLLKNAYLKDKLVHAYLLDGEVATEANEIMIVVNKNTELTDVLLTIMGYYSQYS